MLEKPKPDEDLIFHNVELYSFGRKEYGSLQLLKHHFVFRYHPDKKRANESESVSQNGSANGSSTPKTASLSAESSVITDTSAGSASINANNEALETARSRATNKDVGANLNSAKETRTDSPKRRRPVEMWVAYPLINHCVLRPSHSPSQIRPQILETPARVIDKNEDLFPPTYGTPDYTRPSSESGRAAVYSPSPRPASPLGDAEHPTAFDRGRQPAIRLRLKDFKMMALHFHAGHRASTPDDTARQVFYAIRERCCVDEIEDFHAFHFSPPKEERMITPAEYDARKEYARMGIGNKAVEGPGSAWRITDINCDYSFSATYPSVLCVPRTVSDNLLKYGGVFRSRSRIPCLSYLHSNGGSITRSSQPMVGLQNKRNPQDERLVWAIFSSHTAPSKTKTAPIPISATSINSGGTGATTSSSGSPQLSASQTDSTPEDATIETPSSGHSKIYGSTRRSLIVDARPKINALANRASGGGIEDLANYKGNGDIPVEKIFLNVANIHVMRASLEKVMESFANSDYIKVKPDQEALRKSSWLGHIAGVIDGTEMIVRAVGLGGSHVLLHCSDGWDRTAQISALAQIMMDPHSRTLQGFITLVQKEFLSFGHKFRDRNGIESNDKWFEIENERIAPSRTRESTHSDPTSLPALGAKALSGAKNWFEKGRGNLFGHHNSSQENISDKPSSRPPSPPPNPLIHSPASNTPKDEKPPKASEKEVAPIFHQFLDSVYQLLRQQPDAFEFNERFLRRLFYHAYSCQYGEFLFNCEKERGEAKQNLGSVWSHFLSRKEQFINPNYVAKVEDPLLLPNRSKIDREVEVKWWHELFGRSDEEMNVPRALMRPDTAAISVDSAISGSFDEKSTITSEMAGAIPISNGSIKDSARVPAPSGTSPGNDARMSFTHVEVEKLGMTSALESVVRSPSTDFEVVDREAAAAYDQADVVEVVFRDVKSEAPKAQEHDGDPLGVTTAKEKPKERSGLDFAAFASQNAFRDR